MRNSTLPPERNSRVLCVRIAAKRGRILRLQREEMTNEKADAPTFQGERTDRAETHTQGMDSDVTIPRPR